MIDFQSASARAKDQLTGFPPELIEGYLSYSRTGEYTHLDTLILGMLEFYLSIPPSQHLSQMPGSTRLIQDLGCDSLAMVETLFGVISGFLCVSWAARTGGWWRGPSSRRMVRRRAAGAAP